MTSDVAPGGSVIASECVLALDSLDSHVPRATAVDRQVVRRETQRASVVGYSCWESVASQAALEAVGEEGRVVIRRVIVAGVRRWSRGARGSRPRVVVGRLLVQRWESANVRAPGDYARRLDLVLRVSRRWGTWRV